MFSILRHFGKSRLCSLNSVSNCQRTLLTLDIEKAKARKILLDNDFTEDESNLLVERISPYLKCASQIEDSLSFWRKMQRNLSKNSTQNNVTQFKNVFLTEDPRLMLVESNFLHERMSALQSLDLVSGSKDLWKLFITSPGGYYMQDWKDFLRKYYYITFKILPWIDLDESKNKTSNPLMKYPQVIELPYNTIKTRLLFVQRAGSKTIGNVNENVLNLKNLLLTTTRQFLRIFAPNVTEEEYYALEKINLTQTGEEDDKLFEDLVSLAPKEKKKEFFENLRTETYVLSPVK